MCIVITMTCGNLYAQNVIRGIITDENNQPMPGVSILLNSAHQGTTTNEGGRFTISAQKGQTLTIRFLGYQQQDVVIGAENTIAIQMKSEGKNLTEVVVTALGVKKEIRKLGYSQTEIKGEEINYRT